MTKNIHRPLVSIVISLGTGILVEQHVTFSINLYLTLALLFLLASLFMLKKRYISGCFLVLAFVLLGMVCSRNYKILSENHLVRIARYYKRNPVRIEGLVVSDVEKRAFFKGTKTNFVLSVSRFETKWGWRKRTGKVLVNVFRNTEIAYGDYVFLKGKLYRPFNFGSENQFSYKEYLERRNIKLILSVNKQGEIRILRSNAGNSLRSKFFHIKHKLSKVFAENLTKNESALMHAIILGDRYLIPKPIRELFVQTGTAHILAISGLHVGIVAFVIFVFLRMLPLGRKAQYLLTIIFLVFYSFLTGGRPSVIRATIMCVIFISGFLLERESEAVNSLALAALVLLLINPLNLFDVGFQLSFISVLSILFLSGKIIKRPLKLPPHLDFKVVRFFIQSFSVSLAVWVGVAGLIAYYFQIITPVTILANLFVIPIMTVVLSLGFGMLFFANVLPILVFVFVPCIKLALNIMVICIYLLRQLPLAYIYLTDISSWHIVIYYIVVLGLFYLPAVFRHNFLKEASSGLTKRSS